MYCPPGYRDWKILYQPPHRSQCAWLEYHEDLLSFCHGKTSLISKVSSWFGMYREKSLGANKDITHLKDYHIETFPPFLRPFYLRTLNTNASILTNLTFKHIYGHMGAIDWGFLVTDVHLPVLKRFSITFGLIPRDALIKFLFKHSHITIFECQIHLRA